MLDPKSKRLLVLISLLSFAFIGSAKGFILPRKCYDKDCTETNTYCDQWDYKEVCTNYESPCVEWNYDWECTEYKDVCEEEEWKCVEWGWKCDDWEYKCVDWDFWNWECDQKDWVCMDRKKGCKEVEERCVEWGEECVDRKKVKDSCIERETVCTETEQVKDGCEDWDQECVDYNWKEDHEGDGSCNCQESWLTTEDCIKKGCEGNDLETTFIEADGSSWTSTEDCDEKDGYYGSSYCSGGDVKRKYKNYYCSGSSCDYNVESRTLDSCGSHEKCVSGTCKSTFKLESISTNAPVKCREELGITIDYKGELGEAIFVADLKDGDEKLTCGNPSEDSYNCEDELTKEVDLNNREVTLEYQVPKEEKGHYELTVGAWKGSVGSGGTQLDSRYGGEITLNPHNYQKTVKLCDGYKAKEKTRLFSGWSSETRECEFGCADGKCRDPAPISYDLKVDKPDSVGSQLKVDLSLNNVYRPQYGKYKADTEVSLALTTPESKINRNLRVEGNSDTQQDEISESFELDKELPQGDYRLEVSINDQIAGKTTKETRKFELDSQCYYNRKEEVNEDIRIDGYNLNNGFVRYQKICEFEDRLLVEEGYKKGTLLLGEETQEYNLTSKMFSDFVLLPIEGVGKELDNEIGVEGVLSSWETSTKLAAPLTLFVAMVGATWLMDKKDILENLNSLKDFGGNYKFSKVKSYLYEIEDYLGDMDEPSESDITVLSLLFHETRKVLADNKPDMPFLDKNWHELVEDVSQSKMEKIRAWKSLKGEYKSLFDQYLGRLDPEYRLKNFFEKVELISLPLSFICPPAEAIIDVVSASVSIHYNSKHGNKVAMKLNTFFLLVGLFGGDIVGKKQIDEIADQLGISVRKLEDLMDIAKKNMDAGKMQKVLRKFAENMNKLDEAAESAIDLGKLKADEISDLIHVADKIGVDEVSEALGKLEDTEALKGLLKLKKEIDIWKLDDFFSMLEDTDVASKRVSKLVSFVGDHPDLIEEVQKRFDELAGLIKKESVSTKYLDDLLGLNRYGDNNLEKIMDALKAGKIKGSSLESLSDYIKEYAERYNNINPAYSILRYHDISDLVWFSKRPYFLDVINVEEEVGFDYISVLKNADKDLVESLGSKNLDEFLPTKIKLKELDEGVLGKHIRNTVYLDVFEIEEGKSLYEIFGHENFHHLSKTSLLEIEGSFEGIEDLSRHIYDQSDLINYYDPIRQRFFDLVGDKYLVKNSEHFDVEKWFKGWWKRREGMCSLPKRIEEGYSQEIRRLLESIRNSDSKKSLMAEAKVLLEKSKMIKKTARNQDLIDSNLNKYFEEVASKLDDENKEIWEEIMEEVNKMSEVYKKGWEKVKWK